MPDDYYVSRYSGEEIDDLLAKASAAVRYDAAQSLTAAQQELARNNIYAAPGGYGYGGYVPVVGRDNITDAEFVEMLETRLSKLGYGEAMQVKWINHPTVSGETWIGTLWKHTSGNYAVLTGETYSGYMVIRTKANGVWKPTEWVYPGMLLGVEYRTIEHYLLKPVYTKLVNCGALPNATQKSVEHGVQDVRYMLSCQANCTNGSFDSLPYWNSTDDYCTVYASTTAIIFSTPKDLSNRTANAIIKYTKTTD